MKRLVLLLGVVAAALLAPAAAPRTRSATSRSTASAASRSRATALYVRYVLDMAEIPTFQAGRIDAQRPTRGGSPAAPT